MEAKSVKKAVILGASGPAGYYLTGELLRRGIHTRVVARKLGRLHDYFAELDVECVAADLLSAREARSALESCDVAFLCAGVSMSRFEDHLVMTRNITEGINAEGAAGVLLSSFWSYGPSGLEPVSETGPRVPQSPKQEIRLQQEDLFTSAGGAVVILPDFYGPRADKGFLNPALRSIYSGRTANWIGDLERPREFLFVPDMAFPIVELSLREESFGKRWNLAGAEAWTPRQFLEVGASYCEEPLRIRKANRLILSLLGLFNAEVREIKELYDLYMNPPILDMSSLQGLIGDIPVTPYPDGIRQTVDWIRAGPESRPG